MTTTCKISVGIPTYKRVDQLLETLHKILTCDPIPNEIIVHIDAGDNTTEDKLLACFSQVKIIKSNKKVGPGGGRNKILMQATNSIVASFDDDSYPIDTDYFSSLLYLFEQYPSAAIIGAKIYHPGECVKEKQKNDRWVLNFTGCGCAYRRGAFLQTSGYVDLPVAYGMEEVDLALRLHCVGWKIIEASSLRVFHDTQLAHHAKPSIIAGSIANIALFIYLRYPLLYWGYGFLQYVNRIYWLAKNGRMHGIMRGLFITPMLISQHWNSRQPVKIKCLASYLALRDKAFLAEPKHV